MRFRGGKIEKRKDKVVEKTRKGGLPPFGRNVIIVLPSTYSAIVCRPFIEIITLPSSSFVRIIIIVVQLIELAVASDILN